MQLHSEAPSCKSAPTRHFARDSASDLPSTLAGLLGRTSPVGEKLEIEDDICDSNAFVSEGITWGEFVNSEIEVVQSEEVN